MKTDMPREVADASIARLHDLATAMRAMKRAAKSRQRVGWFEEYQCGCVSETVRVKRDLLGYCGTHGDERRAIFPAMKEQARG